MRVANARRPVALLLLLLPLVLAALAAAAAPFDATAHMQARRRVSPNLMALLLSASYAAEQAVAPERRTNLFATQGNIFDVPDEECSLRNAQLVLCS